MRIFLLYTLRACFNLIYRMERGCAIDSRRFGEPNSANQILRTLFCETNFCLGLSDFEAIFCQFFLIQIMRSTLHLFLRFSIFISVVRCRRVHARIITLKPQSVFNAIHIFTSFQKYWRSVIDFSCVRASASMPLICAYFSSCGRKRDAALV